MIFHSDMTSDEIRAFLLEIAQKVRRPLTVQVLVLEMELALERYRRAPQR
jgi:hypothetical protein